MKFVRRLKIKLLESRLEKEVQFLLLKYKIYSPFSTEGKICPFDMILKK